MESKRRDSIQTPIKVMSYNIYVGSQTDERRAAVIKMIEGYMPDVFGVQEADPKWMRYLTEKLPMYAYVGEGRNGGDSGEYSAIFYLKEKFDCMKHKTRWLSDTPDQVSKVEESSLNRVYTYALLCRRSDGTRFIHINTHFEHTSDIAREKQAEVLAKGIGEMKEYPIILTGDLNTTAQTKAFETLINAGMTDSASIASKGTEEGTFHGYAGLSSTIDFCLVTKENISVSLYKVCNEMIDGAFASDHHPVYTELVI